MSGRLNWTRTAQLFVVLICAYGLKSYYSTASPEQLRWILAPTTQLVELISRRNFGFEAHAGYLSSDRTFLIAGSCAGVNFLITSFLMLSLRRLWNNSAQRPAVRFDWLLIPVAGLTAYVATLVANTVRICVALQMRELRWEIDGLNANQLHRFEGIFVYFGFLLLLFIVTDHGRDQVEQTHPRWLRESVFPLLIYYLTTLGIPLANIAYHRGSVASDFWEHSLFVLLTPIPLLLLVAGVRWCRQLLKQRGATVAWVQTGR